VGLRGPAPIPIEIKRARGNPGKRTLPKPQDLPNARLSGDLYCPDDLSESAKQVWDRLVPLLTKQGVLSDESYLVVAHICRVEGRRKDAAAIVQESGMECEGEPHPMLRTVEKCEDQLRPLYREVGITPASRGGVPRAAIDKQANPWDDL
jgi:P27 family predicted phage terminase small subunit